MSSKEGPIMSKWIYNSVPAFSNYFNVEWTMSNPAIRRKDYAAPLTLMIRAELVIESGDEDRTRTTTTHAGSGNRWKETRGEDTDGRRRINNERCNLFDNQNRERSWDER